MGSWRVTLDSVKPWEGPADITGNTRQEAYEIIVMVVECGSSQRTMGMFRSTNLLPSRYWTGDGEGGELIS